MPQRGHLVSAVNSPLNLVPTFRRRGRQQRRHLLSGNSGRGGQPRFLRVNFRQLLGADETSAFALDSRLRFDGTLLDASATVHLELILLLGLEIAPLPRRQETFEHAHRPGAGKGLLSSAAPLTSPGRGWGADPVGSDSRDATASAASASGASRGGSSPVVFSRWRAQALALRCGAGTARQHLLRGSRVRTGQNLGRQLQMGNARFVHAQLV